MYIYIYVYIYIHLPCCKYRNLWGALHQAAVSVSEQLRCFPFLWRQHGGRACDQTMSPCQTMVKHRKGMSDEWCNQSHLEKLNHGFQWHGHFRLRLDGEGSTPPAKDSQALKGSGWFRRVLCRNAFCVKIVKWMVSTGAASCWYWNTFTWCSEPLPSKLTRPIVCQQLFSAALCPSACAAPIHSIQYLSGYHTDHPRWMSHLVRTRIFSP